MTFNNSNPILIFEEWFREEKKENALQIPEACCLSTVGIDGYPNARFVSLKEVKEGNFIVTGPLSSRKGIEINSNPFAALTFWWDRTERQIRIQGVASKISDQEADVYFADRNRVSQLVSNLSQQGESIENLDFLRNQIKTEEKNKVNTIIKRPENWGGFRITPIRIELMTFNSDRFHERKLFIKKAEGWDMQFLQP